MKKCQRIILLFLLGIFFNINSINDLLNFTQPRWNEKLNLVDIEQRLKTEKIIYFKEIVNWQINESVQFISFENFTSYNKRNSPFLVILESGLKAILKLREQKSFAEIAAYEFCKFLDLRLVPPTVGRKIGNFNGSLQLFIEPDFKDGLDLVNQKGQSDFRIVMFILGQYDIKPENRIVQKNNDCYNLALIDNERIWTLHKVRYLESPFVLFNKIKSNSINLNYSFPFDQAQDLYDYDYDHLNNLFSTILKSYQIRQLANKIRKEGCIKYCIWQDTLWIQEKAIPDCYTNIFYNSTLKSLSKLNFDVLKNIWREGYHSADVKQKSYYHLLFHEILNRKDQVLKISKKNRIIDLF